MLAAGPLTWLLGASPSVIVLGTASSAVLFLRYWQDRNRVYSSAKDRPAR
jgi:hypothetical protein